MENITKLLNIYDKVMFLKIFVDSEDELLKHKYVVAVYKHNNKYQEQMDFIDAGFDLLSPGCVFLQEMEQNKKLDYKIKCAAVMYTDKDKMFNTGYYLYPRSSLSKTPLRLANSTGICDAGYRGNIMAAFDIIQCPQKWMEFKENPYDRYVQICAPGLVPIYVEVVDRIEQLGIKTQRGEGGFGSTGK
jgi:dUTP pyrophosphatase